MASFPQEMFVLRCMKKQGICRDFFDTILNMIFQNTLGDEGEFPVIRMPVRYVVAIGIDVKKEV